MTEGNNRNGRGERPFSITRELEGGPPSRRPKQETKDPLRMRQRSKGEITISNGDISRWKEGRESALPPSVRKMEQKPHVIHQRPKETELVAEEIELDETDFTDGDAPYTVLADEHSDDNIPWAELDDSSLYAKTQAPEDNVYNLIDKTPDTRSVGKPNLPYPPALVKKDNIPYAEPVDPDPEGIELGEDTPSIREASIYLKDFFLFNNDRLAAELAEFVIEHEKLPDDGEALETIWMMNLPDKPTSPIIESARRRVITKLKEFMAKTKNELKQEDAERRESIKLKRRVVQPKEPPQTPARRRTDTMTQAKPRILAELSPGDAVEISGTAAKKIETPKTPTSPPRHGDTILYEAVSRTTPLPIPVVAKTPEAPPQHTQVQAQETPQSPQEKKGVLSRLAESRFVRRVTQGLTVLAVTVGLKKETHDIAPPYAPTHTQTTLRSTESENTAERRAAETARQILKNTSRPAESEQTSRAKNKPEPILRVAEPEDSITHRNDPEPTPTPPIVVDLRNTSRLSVEDERRLNKFDPTKRSIPKPAPLTGEALKKWNAELASALRQAELATLTPEQIATRNQAIDTVLQTDREADEALEVAADLADDGHFDSQQFKKASETIMKKHAHELKQIEELLRTQGGINPELSKIIQILKNAKNKNPGIPNDIAVQMAFGELSIADQIKARQQADKALKIANSSGGITPNLLRSIAK